MMTELVDFYATRLDEEEQIAKAATAGPWSIGEPLPYGDPDGGLSVVSGDDEVAGSGHSGGGVWAQVDADHILRHDPARVLRDVEVGRRILGLYTASRERDEWMRQATGEAPTALATAAYGEALKALALSHADHEDYQEAWRPE